MTHQIGLTHLKTRSPPTFHGVGTPNIRPPQSLVVAVNRLNVPMGEIPTASGPLNGPRIIGPVHCCAERGLVQELSARGWIDGSNCRRPLSPTGKNPSVERSGLQLLLLDFFVRLKTWSSGHALHLSKHTNYLGSIDRCRNNNHHVVQTR